MAMAQLAPNPFAVTTNTPIDFPQRKKGPIIVIAVIVLAAAAGVALALYGSPAAPPPPPVPTVTVPIPAAPSYAAPSSTTPSGISATTGNGSRDPLAQPSPVASAGGDFSQMFAAGAKAKKSGAAGSAAH
jgi:hypothetical protein